MVYELSFLDDPSPEIDLRRYYFLGSFDRLEDDNYDEDWPYAIHVRSGYEFIRDRLTDAQHAQLDEIDAYWKAHPKVFNKAFTFAHFRQEARSLDGFVLDEAGNVPEIPPSHWWWWPLDEAAD